MVSERTTVDDLIVRIFLVGLAAGYLGGIILALLIWWVA
jgi:hypothetical protein